MSDPYHLCVPSQCLLCRVAAIPLSHSHSSPSLPSPCHSPTRSQSLTPPPLPNALTVDQGPTCGTVVAMGGRRHRHGISGQMSYFKMLGFGVGKKMSGASGSTNSLFSTAVISGSSSAPNLRDMIPNSASVSAIEGCGGVPPIRPLETLHNALSLRQLDSFLEIMTSLALFRTPASSPPKNPSTPLTTSATHHPPLRLQSPSSSLVWSGPPSFVSSSGPSSPNGMSDIFSSSRGGGGTTGTSESSEMSLSASLISNDGYGELTATLANIFPAVLDQDLSNVGILLEGNTDFYPQPQEDDPQQITTPRGESLLQFSNTGGDSGDVTPVSVSASSEFDFTSAAPRYSGETEPSASTDIDVTVVEIKSEDEGGQTTGRSGGSTLLAKSVESLGQREAGLCTRLIGQWVLESAAATGTAALAEESSGADTSVTVDQAEEEERTITSSMTATSPARKTIFQVFGSPVSRYQTSRTSPSPKQSVVMPIKEDSQEVVEVCEQPSSLLLRKHSPISISREYRLSSPVATAAREDRLERLGPTSPSPVPSSPSTASPVPKSVEPKRPIVSSFTKEYKLYAANKSPQSDSGGSTEGSYKSIKDPESVGRIPGSFSCFSEDTSSALSAGLAEEGFGSLSRQRFDNDGNSEELYEEAVPVLTLASSLKDSSSISRGFHITKDENK